MSASVDPEEENSVFDFLYHDARRVASFLAQLNPNGHVQGTKRLTESTSTSQHEGGLDAAASVLMAKANLNYQIHNTTSSRDNLELTIDPTWSNAIDLLNLLTDRNLIARSLRDAGIGSIIIVTAKLAIFDTEHATAAFNQSEIKSHITASFAQLFLKENSGLTLVGDLDHKTLQGSARKRRAERDAKLTLGLLEQLPRTVQMRARTAAGELIYCSIRPENLVVPITDLVMSQGPEIDGNWAILGIYDARPDKHNVDVDRLAKEFKFEGSQLLRSAVGFAPMLRQVGRGDDMHVITPLLIFRKVVSATGQE